MPTYAYRGGVMVCIDPRTRPLRTKRAEGAQGATLAEGYRRLEETGQLARPRGPAALTPSQVKEAIRQPDCPTD
jgi:hypothetical protein